MESATAKNYVLQMQHKAFCGRILIASVGYLIITLWLNSIRATASLWIVWVLIIIQFIFYFSIFISGYQRSRHLISSEFFAPMPFVILALLGRVDDWQVVIIPVFVFVMLILSSRIKAVSENTQAALLVK